MRSDSHLSLTSPILVLESRKWEFTKTLAAYGLIRSMVTFSINECDYILLTSDSGNLSVLDGDLNSLYNITVDVPGLSMNTLGYGLCIDSSRTYVCIHALEEMIKILEISISNESVSVLDSVSLMEFGLIYIAEFISTSSTSFCLALAVVESSELHIVLYEKQVNASLQETSCTGSISLGKGLVPLKLIALPDIPSQFLVVTDDGCFILSCSQIKSKTAKKERIQIPGPFHTREIPERTFISINYL